MSTMRVSSTHRLGFALIFIILAFGLTACTASPPVTGRLIVWHTWDEAEAPIIEQLLDDFQRINPDIHL